MRGLIAFTLFEVVCGATGNFVFGLIHPHEPGPLFGASGAVSALVAAASRLVAGRGEVGPIASPFVISMGGAWIVINLLTAVFGFTPGMSGANVAWEVHLAGFALGLVAIGPAGRIAGRAGTD